MATSGTIGFIVQEVPDAFRERARLRRWLQTVAQDHGTRIDAVSFVLMTDKALLYYNQTFLHHDDHTDVITFPVESNNGVAGDVLMSYERIRENAATFGVSARHELHRVMVHGLLHLLGHKDKTKAQREAMRGMEEKYLARFAKV
ncbi:MAG: rRNA maturation RNase YbeY [Flavobacteriales bacterium]|nr:rRNA maturation RNase YbeY [Flavobacteriales bacterium]